MPLAPLEVDTLSHSAKNVVCNILGALEILDLEQTVKDEVSLEMLDVIKSAANELMDIIQKIVVLAKT